MDVKTDLIGCKWIEMHRNWSKCTLILRKFFWLWFFSINIKRQIDRNYKKFYTNSLIYLLISALNILFIYLSIYYLYNLFIHPSSTGLPWIFSCPTLSMHCPQCPTYVYLLYKYSTIMNIFYQNKHTGLLVKEGGAGDVAYNPPPSIDTSLFSFEFFNLNN